MPRLGTSNVGTTKLGSTSTTGVTGWEIDGTAIDVKAVSLTPATITVGFETDRDSISTWRNYDHTGGFRRKNKYGGGWRLIERAGRSSEVTVTVPSRHKPPLDNVLGYTQGFQEEKVAADRFEIDLTVGRSSERKNLYSAPTQTGGHWQISLNTGSLALAQNQVSPTTQSGSKETGQWTLNVQLSDEQAGAIADVPSTPDAVISRGVGENPDTAVDTTGGRQTLTISAPAGSGFPDGDYIVSGWSIEHVAYAPNRKWAVELTLQEG